MSINNLIIRTQIIIPVGCLIYYFSPLTFLQMFCLSNYLYYMTKKNSLHFFQKSFFPVFLKDFILHKKAKAVVDIFSANSFSHFVVTLLCILRIYTLLILVNSSFSVQTSRVTSKILCGSHSNSSYKHSPCFYFY